MSKIFIVEDEPDLASQIELWLKCENYLVDVVLDGQSALDRLAVYKYDLVILDWMLPDIDGIGVCKQFREKDIHTPVLMLTAKASIDNKEAGLDAGADDYLAKPFNMRELSARVRALLRRGSIQSSPVLRIGDITLDPVARRSHKGSEELHLEPKQFNLLEFLMRNVNQTFSSETLLERVWESESNASPETVRTYISALRHKIDTKGNPSRITTVYGIGYRFEREDA